MRVFALETDPDKIKRQFLSPGEREVLFTRYHALSFFFACIREILITVALFGIGVFALFQGWPMFWITGALAMTWAVFVFFSIFKAYIDWMYDFIFATTDKVVLVDQTSFIRRKINPIHLDNIGSVTAVTQFWGIFNFGIIKLHLKEGLGGDTITLRYVPNATEVVAKIADVVTNYQRRLGGSTALRRQMTAEGTSLAET